jgi:hypothetical protein
MATRFADDLPTAARRELSFTQPSRGCNLCVFQAKKLFQKSCFAPLGSPEWGPLQRDLMGVI